MNPFEEEFEKMMKARRDYMLEHFHRVLPSGELIYNRFDKSRDLNFPKDSSIYDTSILMGDVRVGSHVWIGPYTLLDGSAGTLCIGDYVSIDAGVMIYTHDSTKHYVSGGRMDFEKGPVSIGSYTVIGTGSTVSCNVSIGSHCAIGAHSFVNSDIEDWTIAAGCPARPIGRVLEKEDGSVEFVYDR